MLPGRVVRCRHDWADDLDPASAVVELPAVESIEESGTCCFARHDDVWVDGPDGAWEIYTVLEDSDPFGQSLGKGRRPAWRDSQLRIDARSPGDVP